MFEAFAVAKALPCLKRCERWGHRFLDYSIRFYLIYINLYSNRYVCLCIEASYTIYIAIQLKELRMYVHMISNSHKPTCVSVCVRCVFVCVYVSAFQSKPKYILCHTCACFSRLSLSHHVISVDPPLACRGPQSAQCVSVFGFHMPGVTLTPQLF